MPSKPFLLLLFISFCQLSANAQKPFTINGHITGLQDSAILRLMVDNGSVLTMVAVDTVINGIFSFTATQETPGITKYSLLGDGDNFPSSWLDIWAAPGHQVRIAGDGYLFKNWQVRSKIPEQREAARYFAPNAADWKQWQTVMVQMKQLRSKYPGASRQKVKATLDSLNTLSNAIKKRIDDQELATMKKMPVTDMWMSRLKQAAYSTTYNHNEAFRQQVIALYNGLPEAQRNSRTGMEAKAYLYPPVVVKKGEPLADTTMVDLEGKTHRLSDYKGRYLLLDFWSVGCGPCIAAMPELDSIATLQPSKLLVVSINIDEKPAIWKKFMGNKKPIGLQLNDDWGMSGLAARYGVNGIPHYVMISPEGTVADHWVGYEKNDLTRRVKVFLQP